MKPRSYTSEGVVLAKKNYGEADKILVIFSKKFGKVSLIAKSIRRPKSRKRGHLEVFNKITFQGIKGQGLDLLTEAEVIDDYKHLRQDLKRVSVAYYFCEVVGKITHEGEAHEDVYLLLASSLQRLQTEKQLKSFRLDFIFKLLTILGYWPKDKTLIDHDNVLEEVIERSINSMRVGKIISA